MLDWLKEILGEHYTEDIDKRVSDKISKHFVSKADFAIKSDAVKNLENQLIERDRQIDELKKIDTAGLQNQITRLQNENKAAKEKFDADLAAVKLDAALDTAILGARGKNAKAIKALLDTSKLKLNDDGSIDGLDLEAVKKTDAYLFETVEKNQEGTGGPEGSNGNGGSSEAPEDYNAYVQWREKH